MTLNCKGNLIDLSTPIVMGILNLTPDSFYDGGRHKDTDSVLRHTETLLNQGATLIDLGAYSSRPGADHIGESVEMQRLLPQIEAILKTFPKALLSIDTFRSSVAHACLEAGAAIINDISAGSLDDGMLQTVAKHQAVYIAMHMRGNPKTMQAQTQYEDLTGEILAYFAQKLEMARALGICDVVVDPGFGFSKTLEQNYLLLDQMDAFKTLKAPVLAGLSRKSMIYKLLDSTPQKALNGTTALNMIALERGAQILRVHDVEEAVECIALHRALKNNAGNQG